MAKQAGQADKQYTTSGELRVDHSNPIEERFVALETLLTGYREREQRLVTIVADMEARLTCAETALGWRSTPWAQPIKWVNVTIAVYESVRDRTLKALAIGG